MKFNLTRFLNLIRRDFITHKKNIVFICLGVWGIIAIALTMGWASENYPVYANGRFWVPLLLSLLFVGGLTFTSLVFKEFKTPGGRLQFLSIPASNFEKVFSRWIYSLIVFPLFIVGSIWIFSSFFLESGESILGHVGEEKAFLPYAFVLLHAFTFLLALYFNKLVPLKILFTSTILNLLVSLIVVGCMFLIFRDFIHLQQHDIRGDIRMSHEGEDFFKYNVFPKFLFVVKFLVAPFLWIVSYFKMKEKEA